MLDFESIAAFEEWRDALSVPLRAYLSECPIVRTPRPGVHVWVRLDESVPGCRLALFADKGVKCEVRGQGNYVLAPGCPAACHPSGRTYEFVQRGWLDAPTDPMPPEIYFEWIDLAARQTEYTPPVAPQAAPRPPRERTDKNPGDDFNRNGTWAETGLFDVAGWAWERQLDDDRGFVRRPGKAHGIGGSVGTRTNQKTGWPLFYCFTSNGHPFEQGECRARFGVFAKLKHGGDFKAAARALGQMGYGEQRTKGGNVEFGTNTDTIPAEPGTDQTGAAKPGGLVSRSLDEIEERSIDWLWPGRIPAGAITILDGDPGLAKSVMALDFGARLSAGRPMPFTVDVARKPMGVMILASEDSAEHTIRPRARVAGADLKLCRISECIRIGKDERAIRLPDDLDALRDEIKAYSIGMLIIDPLLGFLSQLVDSHKDQSVRDVLHGLKLLCDATGVSVFALRHLNKAGSGNALYRGIGSIAITAAARSALTVDRHPSEQDSLVLAGTKCNVAKLPKSLTYRIGDRCGHPVIEWSGECDLTANDLGTPAGRPDTARKDAEDFLREALAKGAVLSDVLESRAAKIGIKPATLRRAKREIGVQSSKTGFAGAWECRLPANAPDLDA